MSDFFGLNKAEKKVDKEEEKKDERDDDDKKKKDEEDKKNKDEEDKKKKNDVDDEGEALNKDEGGNNKMEQIVMDRIEFDMSQNKKQLRMKAEDKEQMELIRRWQIKIYNIYITPLKDKMDPFVQFTIGGDYSIQVFSNKAGDTYKVPKGERGFAEKTEVIESVEPLNRVPFDKIIELEMRMSYAMINAQKLMIEIWDHNSFFMNTILGYTTINLFDVVNGDINFSFDIQRKEGRRSFPVCTLDFKCIFQEIWDFKLSFVNWKAGPIVEVKKGKREPTKKLESRICILMNGNKVIEGHSTAYSVISKVATAPVWSEFDGVILFRGSQIDLEQSEVTVLLYECGIIDKEICRKTVNLNGIFDFERIKTDFTLTNDRNDKFTTQVEGFVTIDHKIWYKQTGDSVSLLSRRKYLCLNIMRVENIRPAETKGIVDSFISVEWCGQIQRTRTVKENNNPVFNETIYFEIPFPEEWLKEPNDYIQKLNEEFQTKNEVVFNLMIEGDDNTYDNLGIGAFHLSDIKNNGEKTQRKFFAEDLKKDKTYGTRLYVGKCKLISAFSLSTSTNVNFEAWFLDDFPDTVDFGEKKKASDKEDKVPHEFSQYIKKSKNYFQEKFQNNLSKKMSQNNTYNFKERCFNEKYLLVQDQYKNRHYLPYYLSLITPPETIFSKEDRENNKNFHDCNLTTLDEVAHYVHCFPYQLEAQNQVWVSPDFLLKTRKGDVEDHAILCACLMMGLGERKNDSDYEDNKDVNSKAFSKSRVTPTPGMTTSGETPKNFTPTPNMSTVTATTAGTHKPSKKKTSTDSGSTPTPTPGQTLNGNGNTPNGSTPNDIQLANKSMEEEYHPYENRTFVCIGKLKTYKTAHVWVMTITDDYRSVIFWDPHTGLKYELNGRIDDGERLRKFLSGFYTDYESVKANKVKKATKNTIKEEANEDSFMNESKEKEKNLYDELKCPGLNDSYENNIAYNKADDRENKMNDNILDDQAFQMQTNFKTANKDIELIEKETFAQNYDERVLGYKNSAPAKKKFDFLEDQKNQISKELRSQDNSFSPVEEFRDSTGNIVDDSLLNLPYETIDIIFNRNNIWISLNNHDPKMIKYNIYEKSRWMPYFDLEDEHISKGQDKIWTGNFDMFYSLTNFGPIFKPKMVNKMRENLMKEIRVGITAARSGMSLPTRFKKKNEQINDNLGRYLNYLEQRALNRISQKEFEQKIEEWEIMIKQKLPKYFKMESICIFFNFFELEIIRRQITDDLEYFYKTKEKNLMFATSAGVYAYLNQVVSVRIIIAKFYKINEEDVSAEELKDYKESALKANVLEEEQDSDDDEEDETPGKVEMTKLEHTPGVTPTGKGDEMTKGGSGMNGTTGGGSVNVEIELTTKSDANTKGENSKNMTNTGIDKTNRL